MYDVFLSYARSDRGAVQPLVDLLRGMGCQVFLDDDDVGDGASISDAIGAAIDRCRLLVAWYSEAYPTRKACQLELTRALLLGGQEGDENGRILVLNPEVGSDHILPIGLRDSRFVPVGEHPEAVAVEEAAERVARRARSHESTMESIAALPAGRWWNGRRLELDWFVGRTREMWELHSALQASHAAMITSKSADPAVHLFGLGGLGKTLLTSHYAMRFRHAYPGGVYWLSATPGTPDEAIDTTVKGQFQKLLGIIRGDRDWEVELSKLRKGIEEHMQGKGSCLWVVDDIPPGLTEDQVKAWMVEPEGESCFTVMTTRSTEYHSFTSVRLDVLRPDEALELLTYDVRKRGRDLSPAELEAAAEVAQFLGGHSLACRVACMYVAKPGKTFAGFLAQLHDPSEEALELAAEYAGVLPENHEVSILATLLLSIDALGQRGASFLGLASILAPILIPASFMESIFQEQHGAQKGMQIADAGSSDAVALSLANEVDEGYLVHSLVSMTVRAHRLEPGAAQDFRAAAVTVLHEEIPGVQDARDHSALFHHVGHCRHLLQGTASSADELPLLGLLARHDYLRGNYPSAVRTYGECERWSSEAFGSEMAGTLRFRQNRADALRAAGDLQESKRLSEEVLAVLQASPSSAMGDVMTVMNNLALIYGELGDHKGMRRMLEVVARHDSDLPGSADDADRYRTMTTLASAMSQMGDHAASASMAHQALEGLTRCLGEDHQDTLTAMDTCAFAQRELGQIDEALRLHERALEAREELLGEEHPETLVSRANLATALRASGRFGEARDELREVLAIRRRTLGERHPDTLLVLRDYASASHAAGDRAEAKACLLQAKQAMNAVLGPDHPESTRTLLALATTLEADGQMQEALDSRREAFQRLKSTLGPRKAETLNAQNDLALSLQRMGLLDQAQQHLEHALEGRREVLGEDHPDTLAVLGNLSWVCREVGDVERALPYSLEAFEGRSRKLGDSHPSTLKAANTLAAVYMECGRLEEARTVFVDCLERQEQLLGRGHYDTIITRSNLGGVIRDIALAGGRPAAASRPPRGRVSAVGDESFAKTRVGDEELLRSRSLLQIADADMVALAGEGHPDTLKVTSQLANTLVAQEDYPAARDAFIRLVDGCRLAHGESDPRTLACTANLVGTYRRLGELALAQGLAIEARAWARQTLDRTDPIRQNLERLARPTKPAMVSLLQASVTLMGATGLAVYFMIRGGWLGDALAFGMVALGVLSLIQFQAAWRVLRRRRTRT